MQSIMKWNLIPQNIRGLNDPENIRCFINSLPPKADIVMIQEHNLRGNLMENIGTRLIARVCELGLRSSPERAQLA